MSETKLAGWRFLYSAGARCPYTLISYNLRFKLRWHNPGWIKCWRWTRTERTSDGYTGRFGPFLFEYHNQKKIISEITMIKEADFPRANARVEWPPPRSKTNERN